MSLRPLAKILNNAKSTKLTHPTAQCTVYNIQYYTIYRFLKDKDKDKNIKRILRQINIEREY